MKKESRFAHSEGITDISYKKTLLTTGSDGEVRRWKDYDDDDPTQFSVEDSCLCLGVHNDIAYIGTEGNKVEVFNIPNGKSLGVAAKFNAGVNHLDVSKNGKLLVAGSGDMTIQFIKIETAGEYRLLKTLDAHSAPVISVVIDPLNAYVASAGSDGTVCIWSFKDDNADLVKKFEDLFPKTNDIKPENGLCRMAWNSSGKILAIPQLKKIFLYDRDEWTSTISYENPAVEKAFSIVRFSPCEKYIAGGGCKGEISVWDAKTCNLLINTGGFPESITGMVFYNSNELICADLNGRLIQVKQIGSKHDPIENGGKKEEKTIENDKDDIFGDGIDDVFDDGNDDLFIDNQDVDKHVDMDDSDNENEISITKIKAKLGFIDDEYVGVDNAIKGIKTEDGDDVRSVGEPSAPIIQQVVSPFTKSQEPFQPSSSPVFLDHRFMAWNNVGIIRCYSTEDEEAIDIEFHDVSIHPSIHLRNHYSYSMGTLSSDAIALACAKGENHPSKINCFPIGGINKEWTIDFPKGEEITCIGIGKGWVAAATTLNRLRTFSIGGVQKFVYDLPGQIIALAGFEDLLFLAYHFGVGINNCQSIFYTILRTKDNKFQRLIEDTPLPLTPKSILTWIGFTDEGTPAFYDSKDTLRVLNGRLWSPYCGMKEHLSGQSDHFWVVGISESEQTIRAIKCKGSKYPPTLPRPTIVMIDAKIPLCEMNDDKGTLENKLLCAFLLNTITKKLDTKGFDIEEFKEKSEVTIQETILKLLSNSLKAERELRYCDYASLMPKSESMSIAVKLASRMKKTALAERVMRIAAAKKDAEDLEVEEIDDFENRRAFENPTPFMTRAYDSFAQRRDTSSSNENYFETRRNARDVEVVPIIDENPLMRKQSDEIRSILSVPTDKKNPFKKNNSICEDSMEESQEIGSEGRGIALIDAWKKPPEKPIVEFNPKNPFSKNATKKKGGEKEPKVTKKRKISQ